MNPNEKRLANKKASEMTFYDVLIASIASNPSVSGFTAVKIVKIADDIISTMAKNVVEQVDDEKADAENLKFPLKVEKKEVHKRPYEDLLNTINHLGADLRGKSFIPIVQLALAVLNGDLDYDLDFDTNSLSNLTFKRITNTKNGEKTYSLSGRLGMEANVNPFDFDVKLSKGGKEISFKMVLNRETVLESEIRISEIAKKVFVRSLGQWNFDIREIEKII